MKAIWYIRGACGDVYSALMTIDTVCKKMHISRSEILFAVDSVYILEKEKHTWQYAALLDMIDRAGIKDYTVMSPEESSAGDIIIHNHYHRRKFFHYTEMSFLRGLHPETQRMIAAIASKEGLYVIATVLTEQTYAWLPGEDIGHRIVAETYKPLPYKLPVEKYDVCIHPRNKYGYEAIDPYTAVIDMCIKKNLSVCIIGNPSEGTYPVHSLINDMRKKATFEASMALAASAKVFVGSNSMYALHRFYSDAGYAMVYSPWSIGDASSVTNPIHYNDLRYMFSDTNDSRSVRQSLDILERIL